MEVFVVFSVDTYFFIVCRFDLNHLFGYSILKYVYNTLKYKQKKFEPVRKTQY